MRPMKTRIVATALLLAAGTVGGTPDFVIVSPPDLRAAWEVYAGRRHAARPDLDIAVTGTDKAVHIVLATPFGLRPNLHSGLVQNVVTLADLFRDA